MEPWSYAWAGLTGLRAERYIRQILAMVPERYVLRGLDTEKYAASIRKAAYLKGASAAHYFQAECVLFELFACLAADLPELGISGYTPSLAARVKFYLDAKYTEKIQLSELAERFHIHPNHLSRVFRAEFGVAPKQYLTERKLEKSGQMLRETDAPVSLIAASLGFEDQNAFSRAFKNSRGVSPMAYRKGREFPGEKSGRVLI